MANVITQIAPLSEAVALSSAQIYANGLQLAKDIDRINRKAGKPSNWAAYFRKTYGNSFGGK